MEKMKILATIDQGNTHPNIAIFSKDQMVDHYRPNSITEELQILQEKTNLNIAISQVGDRLPSSENNIIDIAKYKKEKSYLDMPVNYTKTIGDDRLYSAYYIYKTRIQTKKYNRILLIDSGTFTTMDVISQAGLEGGIILPGVNTYLESYTKGARLPQLNIDDINLSKKLEIPHSTEEAIIESTKLFLKSTFKEYLETLTEIDYIMVTGGNAPIYLKVLNEYHVKSKERPLLIHYALHYIAKEVCK